MQIPWLDSLIKVGIQIKWSHIISLNNSYENNNINVCSGSNTFWNYKAEIPKSDLQFHNVIKNNFFWKTFFLRIALSYSSPLIILIKHNPRIFSYIINIQTTIWAYFFSKKSLSINTDSYHHHKSINSDRTVINKVIIDGSNSLTYIT